MNDKTRTETMKIAIELYDKGHDKEDIINALSQLYKKHNLGSIEFAAESAINMIKSFMETVDKAGGSGWPVDELLKMTFMDLISSLATNGVRFIFDPQEIKNDKLS